MSIAVGPGDEHDVKRFREVLDGIRVKHGVGRLKTRPLESYMRTQHTTRGG